MRNYHSNSTLGLLVLCLVLAAAASLPAQSFKGPSPHIEVSQDYFYFGFMPVDAMVQHKYWIRNKGEDTLQIVSVKPGCGCTAAPLSKDRVAPGDSALLKVIFNSKNMVGKMVKDVEIYSNDPNSPALTVKFFAIVNREHDFVRATPNALHFSKFGSKDGKMIRTVDILNKYDSDITLSLIELPEATFKIDKRTARIAAGEKATFTLQQLDSLTDENDAMTSVTFEFAGKETDRITIPIIGHLQR